MSAPAPPPFALVPRRRFAGTAFGHRRSARRGTGDEVAGTRPYRPGDLRSHIHWPASARLSSARGMDEFVVREFYADEAPWVAVAVDRRPGMEVRPAPSPWLDKRAAADAAVGGIVASAGAVNAPLLVAKEPSLSGGLAGILRRAADLPAGSFVFAVSDFLEAVPAAQWLHLRALRWDVVPVIVQDPVWEQSFPQVGGVSLPLADATGANGADVWLTRRAARDRAAANEHRFTDLLSRFRRLGFDPVVLQTNDVRDIGSRFDAWAERRRRLLRTGRL
jgi:uncharacterized protein (DUF58 family)